MTSTAQKLAAADVIAKAKAKVARVRLTLDGDLLDRHASLTAALEVADEKSRAKLAKDIVALEDDIAAAEDEFVQRGVGRAKWRKLLADHPPTDAQVAEWQRLVNGLSKEALKAAPTAPEYNDGFTLAAIAASLVEPAMTLEELEELAEDLDEVQFSQLWAACLRVNIGGGPTRPESLAARAIVANGRRKSQRPSS